MIEVIDLGFVEVLIVVIFGLLLFLILYLLGVYNQLYFYRKKVEDKFETLNNEINNISNITGMVEDLVKDIYGEDKISDVKVVRRNLEGTDEVNERMHKVVGLIKFLSFVSDHIHDNKELEEYEKEVCDSLDNIKYASEFYNNCVNEYNQYKEKKIAGYLSKIFHFKEYNLCTIIEDANK